ncbi:DUF4426 domain-containing protein [Halopseudomonas pelagia]|uniref:DUF4426 domain-containing protein n=2 Tax=Halopseudomonas pelagia TaxID=553151 RepID=A0AA91U249_9GAMM|nr:DUF4426 domain-containing protein [Halopseudomonas pelagia]PCC99324.1 homoserine acetyltransferase [Halopseudomonas pelagia]QFY55423.1 DUF4426 domain-containing protein [Halopseudomonas pelagia]
MMFRALLLSLLLLPALAHAQQTSPQRFGDMLVYYNTFNSSYLQPDIASTTGLTRGPNHGVVNIAVQRQTADGPVAVDALLTGSVTSLLGQKSPLQFIRLQEDDSIYFVANYTSTQRGLLRFEVEVRPSTGGTTQTLRFQQEFFPDE